MMVVEKFKSLKSLVILAALCALSLAGCGESDSNDVFYVYVVHGYAGGGELSIYGSSGPLATGLEFGDIAGDPELAGAPLAVDRTRFNGDLQILLSGASEVASISLDSFAFYPGETVTLFLTRRSGASTYDLRVLRHTLAANTAPQSAIGNQAAANCVLQVSNGFSLSNTYTPNSYDTQLQINFATPPTDPSTLLPVYETPNPNSFLSTCGEVQISELNGSPAQEPIRTALQTRANAMMMLANAGWYYPVRGQSGFLEYRVGQWSDPQGTGATIIGLRSTREFQECLASAVQVPVNAESMGLVQDCDRTKFAEIQVDTVRLNECNRAINYSGVPISPSDSQGTIFYYGTTGQCTRNIRLRTRNVDTVFNPGTGQAADDTLATFNIVYPANSWQHVTFFGTPIRPLIYSFNSSEKAQKLTPIANPPGTQAETESVTPAGGM